MQQNEYVDPRIVRSKEAIHEALISLMLEKNYNKITITDITTRAGLARPTFYLHYKTKEEVLSEIYTDTLVPLYWKRIKKWKETHEDNERAELIADSFDWFRQNKELMEAIVKSGHTDFIIENTRMATNVHWQNLIEDYNVELEPKLFDFLVDYVTGAYSQILIDWIASDMQVDSKQTAIVFARLTGLIYQLVFIMGRMDDLFEIKRNSNILNDSLQS